MTTCARGCCWSPFGCARARECFCHWGDWLQTARVTGGADRTYADPTANQAIGNVMKSRKK